MLVCAYPLVLLIRVEFERLFVDHFLQNFFGGLEIVPSPIERLLALWFCLLVVQPLEVRVFQALLNSVTFLGVEHEHLP